MTELTGDTIDYRNFDVRLFGRWSFDLCFSYEDTSLKDQMYWEPYWYPHSAKNYQKKRFRKTLCPIIERLVNCVMMHGRNSGKKVKACLTVKKALEIIRVYQGFDRWTDHNPLQIVLQALENGAPREDSTRVGHSGVIKHVSVEVSPLRRVNQAMSLIVSGARRAAFKNLKSMSECLADELMLCAKNNPCSYAIKKKREIERVARGNR